MPNAIHCRFSSRSRNSTTPATVTVRMVATLYTGYTITAGTDGNALSFGGSRDKVSADVTLKDTVVDGNVHTGWYGELEFTAAGDTTIEGDIDGFASKVDFTVESGKTTINGAFDTGNGKDKTGV